MATTIQLKKSSTANAVPIDSDLAVGELAVNTADGLLYTKHTDDSIVTIASDESTKVRVTVDNKSGVTLSKGTPVYITGATGNTFHVDKARADSEGLMPAAGILAKELANDAEGHMIVTGLVSGIDTSSFTSGDELFVDSDGGYTNIAPAGEANLLQKLGVVAKVHASNGTILLQGAGRSNAVPNLDSDQFFLGNSSNKAVATDFSIATTNVINDTSITGLSDVYSSMTPTDGQVLTFDTTNGWQAETPASSGASEDFAIAMAVALG